MISQAEFDDLLQRYLSGRSPASEQRLVEQWSRQLGQDENLLLQPELQEQVRAAMWQRIEQLTQDPAAAMPIPPVQLLMRPPALWQRPVLRWAAVALLGLGVGWWLPRHQPTTQTAHWVQRTNINQPAQQLALADGSFVTLYPGSTLRYEDGLLGARREVYLQGKACFKVAKNPARPFLVFTDKLVTTVLGTTFLVTAYAGTEAKVAVREGRVAVQPRTGAVLTATPAQPAAHSVLLLPNQQAMYSSANKALTKMLVEQPVLLAPQTLTFKNRPVAEVLAALEKAYGVNIVYDPAKLRECTITIDFDKEPLFEQLDALCKALDGSYKKANNAQIMFESPGCNAPG
ncbi:FecR domain-containing protein [Hymenobacter sp. H14-R3]|uniref:FecR family protein n=1 Tax=Hymenobacter sp. H14-R3 TaxID=3046308 RepID=UPI0024B9E8C7|nr:FecR family protein [Hymenobacter sp. H14-R3]MDJ0365711.1 FecR domain-containing protein [Hymenobacter sp. H14-R3]